MNRVTTHLLAALLLVACNDTPEVDDNIFHPTQHTITIDTSYAQPQRDEDSAATLSTSLDEGDRLGVNNSSTANALFTIGEEGAEGDICDTATAEYLYMIAPYSTAGSFDSHRYATALPREQIAQEIYTFGYGRSSEKWQERADAAVELNHLMSYFEINLNDLPLPPSARVERLTLRTSKALFVARANIIFGQNSTSKPRYELGAERVDTITLDMSNYDDTTPCFALFPQRFSCGDTIFVEVEIEDEESLTYCMSIAKDMTLFSGNIYPMEGLISSEDFVSGIDILRQIDYSTSPDLSEVERLYKGGERATAMEALLKYYRKRVNNNTPELDMPTKLSDIYRNRADQSLDYRFYINDTYIEQAGAQESGDIFYQFKSPAQESINWQTNPFAPAHESQFESQLHRWAWMPALADAYAVTHDERYAKNFVEIYNSWREAHPMPEVVGGEITTPQNIKYAWNELAVAGRISKYAKMLYSYINSEEFTPSLLESYLVELIRTVEYMRDDYRGSTNILVSQINAILSAGVFFPEIKRGDDTRQALRGRDWEVEGATKITEELAVQFFDDGFHNEATLGYHTGVVNQFFSALEMGARYDIDGLNNGGEFNASLHRSTQVVMNVTYPDYSRPCFNDSFESEELSAASRNDATLYDYYKHFPDDREMLWMATKGRSGTAPTHKKYYMRNAGYYVLRNGWGRDATMLIHTNNPRCYAHNQPDNGTFELYHNGRNFFPDSGSYTYNDGEDRAWFRSARNHNTLTLNEQPIDDNNRQGRFIGERSFTNAELVVTENQSYSNLLHRRSILFVEDRFFVIVDEAMGSAAGRVNLNFNVGGSKCDLKRADSGYSNVTYDEQEMGIHTTFDDGSNIVVRTFADSSKSLSMSKWDGRVSYAVNRDYKRKAYSVDMAKSATEQRVRYVSVILPTSDNVAASHDIAAEFTSPTSNDENTLCVTIDGAVYPLCYRVE